MQDIDNFNYQNISKEDIDRLKAIIDDNSLITKIINIPDISINNFIRYYNQYKEREEKEIDENIILQEFIDLSILLPYYEGLDKWFETNIPNNVILLFINMGVTPDVAKLMYDNLLFNIVDKEK